MSQAASKAAVRERIKQARAALTDRPERSRRILNRIFALPEFLAAANVLFYIDVRTEVQTRHRLAEAIGLGKQIAVPYCVGDELRLFTCRDPNELARGAFGILEPALALRTLPERLIPPQTIDMLLIPGVAFDRHGNRLGYGRGYYDRLLAEVRPDAHRIGLAFACQLVVDLPVDRHDQQLDWIVTEEEVIRTRR